MSGARLGIAGIGLIGGSIALRARLAEVAIFGYDSDPATLARAVKRGIVDAAASGLESLAATSDTLVLALPVDATRRALEQLAGEPGPALIIDVASVKQPLVLAGSRVSNYVGTHPMAGRERGGLDAADAGLFENTTWAYAPHRDVELIEITRAFIAAMGASPLEIDPARHDAIVALTSHLPQALSVLLGSELGIAAQGDSRVMDLCGPGMMSMLRLARSPEALWSPIVAANAFHLAQRLRSIAQALDDAAVALERGDGSPLMAHFRVARETAVALEERFSTAGRSSTYPRP